MSTFKIRHITRYRYEQEVRDSANQIMLYPLDDPYQETLQHAIEISGNPLVHIHEDYFGNKVGTFTHAIPHDLLVIDSRLAVKTLSRPLPVEPSDLSASWTVLKGLRSEPGFIDFLNQERMEAFDEISKLIQKEKSKSCSPLTSAKNICQFVFDEFTYRKGITSVETTVDEIWTLKSGVCQDFAHILLVMLRLLDIPARYVSGYVCPNKSGMRGEGATHAWVEAFIPEYGWLGLDPTNNCVVNDTHVRLAVGKNFTDCSPVRGTYRGTSDHTLEVSVSVAYEDGHTSTELDLTSEHAPIVTSVYKNSFRRHQEIQQQQ